MRTLHLHIKGVTIRVRGRTIDVAHGDPVLDLIERLKAVLKQQGHTTHDDAEPSPAGGSASPGSALGGLLNKVHAPKEPEPDAHSTLHGLLNKPHTPKEASAAPDDGHWVTINGAHVFVNGAGEITKGPAHLVGGNVNDHPGAKHHNLSGGVKSKIHSLLSSGTPFAFHELKHVLGNPPDKALTDAIAQLKNPKWAGPKGALDIVKGKEGKYTVQPKAPTAPAKAPETPAEPDPFAGFTLPKADPTQVAKAPQLDPDIDPDALEWEPGMPEDMKALATVIAPLHGEFLNTKPTTHEGPSDFVMSKAKADVVYEDKLNDVLKNTALAAKELPADQAEKIALAFKQGKSNAMAEWSANTKGTAHTATQQAVFKSDLKLVDNLAHGMNTDEAFAKWKADTALEKQGLLDKPKPEPVKPTAAAATQAPPSKVPPPPQPPPVKASGVPSTATTPHFSKVSEYVPADHVGITASDIGSNSTFSKQITSLKSKLQAGHPDPIQNKKGVQAALTERLKDSAAFQHIKSKFTDSGYGLEGHLISCWAGSSGGSNPTSNAAQLAIRDAFGMNKNDVSYTALSVLKGHGGDEEKVWAACAVHMGLPYEHPDQKAALKAALHDFAIAQHQNTQDHFKQLGITHVYVARGMKTNAQGEASEVNMKLQPASSFSASWDTAHQFSGGSSLYYCKVPVSQVLSSYVTGYGCSNEHELVVLAHPKTVAVEQKVGGHSNLSGIQAAMAHLDKHLPGTGSKKATAGPPKPEIDDDVMENLTSVAKGKIALLEASHAHGDLAGLKQLHSLIANQGFTAVAEHGANLIKHLENQQVSAKPAATSTKFKPAAPPAKPGNVKSMAAKLALKAAKKLDLVGVEAELENLKAKYPTSMVASKQYIPKLVEHVKTQLAAKEAHEAAAKAAKAAAKAAKPKKMAMHGTTPVQAKPVDTTPAAPAEGASFYPSVINTAQQLHKQGNVNALKQYALGLATTANPDDPVHAYVAALTKHLESKAAPATPAAPALHKVVGYAPGVPSHHLNHPHYDPVAYANWQAQGKSEFQIGKTLAAIKFAAKKKAEAAAAKA